MNNDIYTLRSKKLGVMLKEIRESHAQTEENCAHWLGLKTDEYRALENGTSCVSLPQIESLSNYLNFPPAVLTNLSQNEQQDIDIKPEINQSLLTLHDKMIAVQLKQKREELGISLEHLAKATSIPMQDLTHYEVMGEPVPFCFLQEILDELDLPLESLGVQKNSPVESIPAGKQHSSTDMPGHISVELAEFIAKPANLPYLELAMRFSNMDAEKIRTIASSLLEITY